MRVVGWVALSECFEVGGYGDVVGFGLVKLRFLSLVWLGFLFLLGALFLYLIQDSALMYSG